MKNITAIIMAAGKGTRFLPLTSSVPKPLIKIGGKSSLEYNLDNLVGHVNEVVIVVGYLKDEIIKYIGKEYKGIKVKYAYQKVPQGTAHAVYLSEKFVTNSDILVLNGDDVYSEDLINKTLHKGNVIIGKKERDWHSFGVLKVKNGSYLDHIVEKPAKFVGNLVNIGLYKLSSDVFDYYNRIKKSVRGEYEITDLLTEFAKDNPVKIVSCNTGWSPLSFPWDSLEYVEKKLREMETDLNGLVENGAVIKGNVHLGKNSRIKSGSYLEGNFFIGENCEIGPNCYIKGFGTIGNGSKIGSSVEITRSIIGSNTNVKHLAYIGDSILGNKVNIGAGTKVANLRHDGQNVMVKVNDRLVDTGRKKFGAIVGDNVKTGINTLLYPGSKLESNSYTYPGEVVKYGVSK